MTLVFTSDDVKSDVTLCKLDVNVKNRMAMLVALASLNLNRTSLKEKVLLYSKFYLENQMWKIKRYARKSICHGCMGWIEKLVIRDHCSASLGNRDRCFHPHHTSMKDTYIPAPLKIEQTLLANNVQYRILN